MLQYFALLAGTTLAFADAPPLFSILGVAGLLTFLDISQDRALAIRFSPLGSSRVLSLALVQSALSNTLFAALSFAVGRAIAWLMGPF
jgi:hypothetical protein